MTKETFKEMAVKAAITLAIGIPATIVATTITKLVNEHLILPLTKDIMTQIASAS